MAHVEQAIQLDPSFALAYRSLAASYTNLYGPARGAMYYTKAYELRDHASERERLLITADYYGNVLGDVNRASEAQAQTVANYPRYARGRNALGIYYAKMGRYEQAAEMVRAALELPPTTNIYFGNLVNYLMAQQRFDEARETIAQGHSRGADDFVQRLALYGLGFLKGDAAAMSEQEKWLTDRPEDALFGFSIASEIRRV